MGAEKQGRRTNWAALISVPAVLALVLLAVVGVSRLGHSESLSDVIEQYQPRFDELREKLARVADKLPPVGSVKADSLPANLDPKPVYDVRRSGSNTAVLMASQCLNPDSEPDAPLEFDVMLRGNELLNHLRWTGDKNPLPHGGKDTEAKGVAQRFERTLTTAYLVVARPVHYVPPAADTTDEFRGGELDLEVFLIDLPGERVLGAFRRSFRAGPEVLQRFRTLTRIHTTEILEEYAYGDVVTKAKEEVVATLVRATGATFVTDPARGKTDEPD